MSNIQRPVGDEVRFTTPPGCMSTVIWLPSLGLAGLAFWRGQYLYGLAVLLLSFFVLNRASISEATAFVVKSIEAWKKIDASSTPRLPKIGGDKSDPEDEEVGE